MTELQKLRRKYGHHKVAVDYMKARDLAVDYVIAQGGWSNLSDVDKYEMIILFIDDPTVTDPVLTVRQKNDQNKVIFLMMRGISQSDSILILENAYAAHNVLEIEACKKRAGSIAIREVVANYLDIDDAGDFIRTVQNLINLYQDNGIKGLEHGTSGEGLFDFILSNTNSSYAGAGLQEAGYTLKHEHTYQEFKDALMDILQNGNYKR